MHRRLLNLTRDTRWPLMVTILTGLLGGLLTIAQSYGFSSTIAAVFIQKQTLSGVWPWMRALLAILIGRAILIWISDVAANRVAVRIKTDLRDRLFAHVLALGPAYTRGERTGDLSAAAVQGIEALDAYFSQYLPQLVVSALVPISILFIVFPLDPLSGVVLLITAPLIPFFMYMIGRGAEAVTRRQYETLSRLSAHFLDSLQGLTTLKLFGQSKAQARNVARVSDQYRDTTLKVLQVTFVSAFALELLATLSTAIVAVEVGLRLLYAQMEFREALFLLILAPEFYLPLRMLGLRFHAGMAGTSAARRIFEILDTSPQARETQAVNIAEAADPGPFTIQLCGLSYTYPGEARPSLQDVSATIKPGQHVALVGASGAGKTTLSGLLLRFMEPTAGSIRVNGDDLANRSADGWRASVAWVPQRPHLFHESMGANIRFGNPCASDQEVAAAARAAHLDQFIESLPNGYGSIIGEAGARLSSGQAQRLALARAFIKNAPILIMDEPTASLDPETETLLEESIQELTRGRTVITIAHRLNTVIRSDQILVLDKGRLVETGTHGELVRQDGKYARTFFPAGVDDQHTDADSEPGVRKSRPHSLAAEPNDVSERGTGETARKVAFEQPTNLGQPLFLRLLAFLKGSWGWVALSVLLGSLTVGSSVALMGTSSWLISSAALHPSIAVLEVAIVGVRFFGIARAVFRYLERLVSHNVTFRLLARLRTWFYERLEPLAPARLMEYRAGDLLARIVGDVNTLEDFFIRVLAPGPVAILVCLGTALFTWLIDPRLAAVIVSAFLVLGLVLPLAIMRASAHPSAAMIQQRSELHVQLVDGIQGLPDILAFARGIERRARLTATARLYAEAQSRMARVNAFQTAGFALVANLAPWFVLYLAIPGVTLGKISGVLLASLVLATSASFEAVAPLPVAAQAWSSTRLAARRLFEIVDTTPRVLEPAVWHPAPLVSTSNGSRLEFCNVTFTYPGQRSPAIQSICLELRAGQTIAVVGATGSGKSTLVNLALRFWEFDQGDICLEGRSIRAFPSEAVREKLALVSQNSYFFNTSVYENLRLARRGATREHVEAAAKAAQIHDRIVKLREGYDALIGEQGLRLSAGERQRLAIARALLKDAPILLLDEPTANLDGANEAAVMSMLLPRRPQKACLLMTHRLVGLERADEILVMDHGRIVERGREADLLHREGAYWRLWMHQNRFLTER